MEVFPSLTGVYEAIKDDVRISTIHISLHMALLQQWNLTGGRNPLSIERAAKMKAAKINDRYTYNKCINNLQEFGYIKYQPSSNPINCSKVYLNNLKI